MRNKKEDRRSQRTRQALHQAIMALMQEKRYEAITVQDIIDRANVGRSTFYAHYQDKDDLINSNLKDILDGLSHHLDEHLDNSSHSIPVLALFRHVYNQQTLFKSIKGGQGLDLLLERASQYWHRKITEQLHSHLPPDTKPAIPISLIASHLAASLSTYLKWWMAQDLSPSPEKMAEMFHQMVMPGLQAVLGSNQSRLA